MKQGKNTQKLAYEAQNIQFFQVSTGKNALETSRSMTPGEVFDAAYGGLEDLISHNQFTKRKLESQIDTPYWKQERAEEEEEILRNWYANIPDIAAKIEFKDGNVHVMRVRVREDLEFTNHPNPERRHLRMRQPNIVFLEDDNTTLVFREARTYSKKTRKAIGHNLGKLAKPEWTYSFDKPDGDEIRSTILDTYTRKPQALILPEPFLYAALETVYQEGNLPRITPALNFIQVDPQRNSLFALRPFLDPAIDNPVTETTVGTYLGTLQGLGLRGKEDRQRAHYCWQSPITDAQARTLVDIDPDQYFALRNHPQELQKDHANFINHLSSIAPMISNSPRLAKEVEKAQRKATAYADMLLEAVPANIYAIEKQLIQQQTPLFNDS